MGHLFQRRLDENRVVQHHVVSHVLRKGGRERFQLLIDKPGGLYGAGVRCQVDRQGRRRFAVEARLEAVIPGAQLHPGHVVHTHKAAVRLGAHDDVAEIRRLGQTATQLDPVLELLAGRRGQLPHLSCRRLYVLFLHSAVDVGRRQFQCSHAVRPEPQPHAELRTEELHIAHALHALQTVDQIDGGVIRKKEVVVGSPRGDQGQVHQRVGALLGRGDATADHFGRQACVRLRAPVLNLDCGVVAISRKTKSDVQRVGAAAG